ncbi:DNA-binding protein [Vreelandella populi]|uniref:DNA-binding protein n=1 Tax=Vreelandella populi TaxID=2498858 RepID=UPI000F8C6192|nr:DNA-binding protein [Halomonas populi]RUR51947.1 DNA-binding protein [Halomonas populi]
MTTINFEAVSAVANGLVEKGERPTLANVRNALGGGSFTTLSPLLKKWKEDQILEAAEAPLVEDAPEEISSEVNAMAARIWQSAISLANTRLAAEREALEQTRQTLEAEKAETAELADSIEADLARLTGEFKKLQEELEVATVSLADAHNRIALKDDEIAQKAQEIRDVSAGKDAAKARADELSEFLKTEQSSRSSLEAEISRLHERLDDWTTTAATLKAQYQASEKAKLDMQAALEKQIDDLHATLSKRDSELASAVQKAEAYAARLEAFSRDIEKAGRDIEKADKRRDEAQKQALDASTAAARLEGRVAELQKQLFSLKESKKGF